LLNLTPSLLTLFQLLPIKIAALGGYLAQGGQSTVPGVQAVRNPDGRLQPDAQVDDQVRVKWFYLNPSKFFKASFFWMNQSQKTFTPLLF
jgi:hypothetical protein